MTAVAVLGIDLGKNTCSLVGLDAAGAVVLRRRVHRGGLLALVGTLPPCVVAMEACCGAHHVARRASSQGHTPRLMPPEYVRPYVKTTKNDDRDAEAVAEAATRPTMRFVEPKTEAQLDLQALHRVRDRLVAERTALTNQVRGLLLERGVVVAKGRRALREALLGISRRGSTYLRKQLIHGARAVLAKLAGSGTPLGRWLAGLLARTHRNKAVVALANKLARIAWAVLRRGRGFEPALSAAA